MPKDRKSFILGFVVMAVAVPAIAFSIVNLAKNVKVAKYEHPSQINGKIVDINTQVQSLITQECTSIAGTTMTFSLLTFSNDFQPPVYKAVDKNGVVAIIGENNYGQWKCKD